MAALTAASDIDSGQSGTKNEHSQQLTDASKGLRRSGVRVLWGARPLAAIAIVFAATLLAMGGVLSIGAKGNSAAIAKDGKHSTAITSDNETLEGQQSASLPDSEASGSSRASQSIVVYVSGAVAHPGVVELPASARVDDAVRQAGGLTESAQAELVNLAAPMHDGEHVHVPAAGEDLNELQKMPGVVANDSASATGQEARQRSEQNAGTVDLNSADQATLETIPGVGPVMAQRILAWRESHGRFTSVDQLTGVEGIGAKTLAKLKPYVSVG